MTDTITVVGNIASNPEQRTAGPVPVTSFRIATSERRPDGQGAWVDAHTNYYTVSAFRTLGDHAFASLRRGDRVIVSGRLRLKEWTAADGTRGRSVEIDADAVGHDLRFGTTVFQRPVRAGADMAGGEQSGTTESTFEAKGVDDAWSSPDDAWSAPGTGSGGTPPETTLGSAAGDRSHDEGFLDDPTVSERQPSLALAGATPF